MVTIKRTLQERMAHLDLAIPYGLEKLLSMLDVIETESIPSAAVPIHMTPRILINPKFVAKYCEQDECLATLILHELHHVLLGHTRLFRRVSVIHNIAFDAIINAMLCRQNPTHNDLFEKLYQADVFPDYFLRAPIGFPSQPQYPINIPFEHQELISELYYTTRTSFYEVFERIKTVLPIINIKLIGHHDKDDEGVTKENNPALFDVIREIVEQWPLPPDPILGRSLSQTIRNKQFVYKHKKSPEKTIAKAIQRLIQDENNSKMEGRAIHYTQIQQAWPSADRRAFSYQLSGGTPLLYTHAIPIPKSITRAHIYIDVSGSMNDYITAISNAVLSCEHYIKENIFLFSTIVEKISINAFRKGSYKTTQGTDFAIVAEHIHSNKIRSALIITDGFVGPTPNAYLQSCKKANIQILLTQNGYRDDLIPIATHIQTLGAPLC